MHKGTIDLYHFIPLSVTLTWVVGGGGGGKEGGPQDEHKAKPVGFIFLHTLLEGNISWYGNEAV